MYKKEIPELPSNKAQRFVTDYKIRYVDAYELTRNIEEADYYENSLRYFNKISSNISLSSNIKSEHNNAQEKSKGQILANLMINKKLHLKLSPVEFAKKALLASQTHDTDPEEIEKVIDSILKTYPAQVMTYKKGKTGLLGFFVGEVMRIMKGKTDPQMVNESLKKKLSTV